MMMTTAMKTSVMAVVTMTDDVMMTAMVPNSIDAVVSVVAVSVVAVMKSMVVPMVTVSMERFNAVSVVDYRCSISLFPLRTLPSF